MAQTKKKTIWKRWYMIVLYCFVGLKIIGSLLPDSDNSKTNKNSQVNVEQETLTIEQQMEKSVIRVLGNSNRKVDRLTHLSYYIETPNGVVFVKFNINNNLWVSWIRGGAFMDVEKILKVLYTDYFQQTNVVQIWGYFPLTDQYGNVEDVAVLKISMKKETAEKINWDNFNRDNLPILADSGSYYLHPSLKD